MKRFELLIVRVLSPLCMPVPPHRYFGVIEGNRTLIECTTNICPTIRRQSPYNRCVFEVRTQLVILMRDNSFPLSHAVLWNRTTLSSSGDTTSILYRVKYWIRTNVKGFADLHLTNSVNLTYVVP